MIGIIKKENELIIRDVSLWPYFNILLLVGVLSYLGWLVYVFSKTYAFDNFVIFLVVIFFVFLFRLFLPQSPGKAFLPGVMTTRFSKIGNSVTVEKKRFLSDSAETYRLSELNGKCEVSSSGNVRDLSRVVRFQLGNGRWIEMTEKRILSFKFKDVADAVSAFLR